MAERVLKILSLGPSEEHSQSVLHYLKTLDNEIFSQRVESRSELEKTLELNDWDLVISISDLHDLTSLDALSITKNHDSDLPFIIVSDGISEEAVADMMKAGVEDIVIKSRLGRLVHVVRRILREKDVKNKELKARNQANQAHAAREQMLAIVSHDIKNPLSAIQLEAQMLLKIAERNSKTLLAEEVKIQARRILKTTDRLKGLIVDLLDKNKLDVVKLSQEAIDSCRPLLREKDINFRFNFPLNVDELSVDKNKMFQVLSNLICNAIKFTPQSGNITLNVEENDHSVIFNVIDNGPGLKESELNRVFDKYWTAGVSGCSGTGLGLFICKTIIEAHGGHIGVENQESGGAHFWFTLPKILKTVKADFWVKDKNRKILVIDDDEDLREVISWALGKEGYSVHSYSDPKEALASLRNGRHSPQLIVVDFHMDGMKGGEFLKHKNEIDDIDVKDCPVVMISASPEEVEREVTRDLYKEIVTKPIDLEALIGNVHKYLQ
jgi:signal transduction histidine kinase